MSTETLPLDGPGRIIAIANQKGGVGKTTTAINLGTALAEAGRRVLLIDLDPQGNASTGLGIDTNRRRTSTYHLLSGECTLAEVSVPTGIDNLSIAPSTVDLSGIDVEMIDDPDRASRLRRAVRGEAGTPRGGYDVVLIDCPPSLNLLTVNAMTAAGSVLVPLQCEFFALEGITQLLSTVTRVRQRLNPALHIHGIVLTMFDKRNRLSSEVEQDVRANFGDKVHVYKSVIPRNVRLSEAPSHALPALVYDEACAGSLAYRSLADEFLRRDAAMVAA